jgi:hypothetical protein
VVEWLLCTCKALSSNPSPNKRKKIAFPYHVTSSTITAFPGSKGGDTDAPLSGRRVKVSLEEEGVEQKMCSHL